MQRSQRNNLPQLGLLTGCMAALLITAGCSGDKDTLDAGPGGGDAAVIDTGPADAGEIDLGTPDAGFEPCRQDQGGIENRGCDPGMVCNLAMDPPACVPGKACTADNECNSCSDLVNPEECGHGLPLTAFCDDRHGNVCVRSRAPCEPCNEDRDCGRVEPQLGGGMNTCLEYPAAEGGGKWCARPVAPTQCPRGFAPNADNLCVRAGGVGCAEEPIICPVSNVTPNPCPGTGQICVGETCPDTGGALCSTNDLPGMLGTCIGFCVDNSDCPAELPVCNQQSGICAAGCTKGSCAGGQTCHNDGFCAAPCTEDLDCTDDPRYGPGTYCNVTGRPAPRVFKDYRDANSCAPLGCEENVDCGGTGQGIPGMVCDPNLAPPECVPGCYEKSDCNSEELCKSGPQPQQGQSYSREQCRAFTTIAEGNDSEIGVCCDPGCLDRQNQCGLREFCCGEPDSPYADENTCLTLTSTGGVQADPGQCFEMPDDFCQQTCPMMEGDPPCVSGWVAGYNSDPDIMGGTPFQEQEFCVGIPQGMMQIPVCSVGCNPNNPNDPLGGCPGRMTCAPVRYTCLQDADCGGLECINEDTTTNPPTRGQCKCGEDNVEMVACPGTFGDGTPIAQPRCEPFGVEMVCVASYNCQHVGQAGDYPAACGF